MSKNRRRQQISNNTGKKEVRTNKNSYLSLAKKGAKFFGKSLLVLSAVAGILSFIMPWYSGSFAKSDVNLGIRENKLNSKEITRIAYAFPHDVNSDKELMLAQIPIRIVNSGDKSLEDVQISVQYPAVLGVEEGDLSYRQTGWKHNQVKNEHFTSGKYSFSQFQVPSIHPHQTLDIDDGILIQPTSLNSQIEVSTSDKQRVNLDIVAKYSYYINITVVAKDKEPLSYPVLLQVFRAKDADELKKEFLSSYSYNKRLSDASVMDTMRNIIYNPVQRHLLLYPQVSKKEMEQGILYTVEDVNVTPLITRYDYSFITR
jgi:hypothetical protein